MTSSRPLGLVLLVVAGCGSPLSDFREDSLRLSWNDNEMNSLKPQSNPERYVTLWATLDSDDPERCPTLSPSVKATFNGRPMELLYRGERPLFEGYCVRPTFILNIERPEPGTQEAGRLELTDGADTFVLEAENFFAWRGFQPQGGAVDPLSPGQELTFDWAPATDEFSGEFAFASFFLTTPRRDFLSAAEDRVFHAPRLIGKVPHAAPAGAAQLDVRGKTRVPITRCEGPRTCEAGSDVQQKFPTTVEAIP
jgi:hypothetical protein